MLRLSCSVSKKTNAKYCWAELKKQIADKQLSEMETEMEN